MWLAFWAVRAAGQSVCPSVWSWRGYLRVFGGLWKDASTTYAIRGYFENGGDVAYVVRLCGAGSKPAAALWKVGEVDNFGQWTAASPAVAQYRIKATSPGEWANGTRVTIRYRLRGVSGAPEVDMTIQVPSEPAEYFAGLNLDGLECSVAAQSLFIRLIPDGPAVRCSRKPGPQHPDGPAVRSCSRSQARSIWSGIHPARWHRKGAGHARLPERREAAGRRDGSANTSAKPRSGPGGGSWSL